MKPDGSGVLLGWWSFQVVAVVTDDDVAPEAVAKLGQC